MLSSISSCSPRPFLVDEGAGGTDPGIVNQQVDLSFALFQFVQQP